MECLRKRSSQRFWFQTLQDWKIWLSLPTGLEVALPENAVSNNPDLRKLFKNHLEAGSPIPTGSGLPPYVRDCVKVDEDKLKKYLKKPSLKNI